MNRLLLEQHQCGTFAGPLLAHLLCGGYQTLPAPGSPARVCGAKAWLHVQDFEIDAAFDLGLLRTGLACRLALWAERFIMRGFDRVSTILDNMQRKLMGKELVASETLPRRTDN